MESTLGWIDLSAAALRRLRQILEDKPEEVVDEMGVLAIHGGYADHFFPGTSVLQKRPRYAFFACWNYLCLGDGPMDWLEDAKIDLSPNSFRVHDTSTNISGSSTEFVGEKWTSWGFAPGPWILEALQDK